VSPFVTGLAGHVQSISLCLDSIAEKTS